MNDPNWYAKFDTSFCLIGLWMYCYSVDFILIGISRALSGSYFSMIANFYSSLPIGSSGMSSGISLSTSCIGLSYSPHPIIPLLLLNSIHLLLSDVYYINHSNSSHLFVLISASFHIFFQSVSSNHSSTPKTF